MNGLFHMLHVLDTSFVVGTGEVDRSPLQILRDTDKRVKQSITWKQANQKFKFSDDFFFIQHIYNGHINKMKRTKIDITKIHIIRCKATITPVIKLNKEQLQNWVINGLKNRIIFFFFWSIGWKQGTWIVMLILDIQL